MEARLKNMLFMLDVVYRENEQLHDVAQSAIQNITQLLEQLDSKLLLAIEALPEVNNSDVTIEYSHPKSIEIPCTTPHAKLYISLLKHFDLLVQQCDLLWLTEYWEREESREPVRLWSKAISKGIYNCAGYFLPLRRKYIQYQKFLHESDDEAPKSTDQA